jgi:hypothetical protein
MICRSLIPRNQYDPLDPNIRYDIIKTSPPTWTEGAGRFAVGAASSLMQKFFEAPDRSLFATIKSSPNAI